MSLAKITDQALDRKSEPLTTYSTTIFSKSSIVQPTVDNATNINTALTVLFAYIPTEIIALYIAVVSVVNSTNTKATWITFLIFLIFTPVVVWLIFAAKYLKANGKMPYAIATLPIWEMMASTVSFVAWAFALPNSVFHYFSWYSQSVAGIGILLTSTILGLISPFFIKD